MLIHILNTHLNTEYSFKYERIISILKTYSKVATKKYCRIQYSPKFLWHAICFFSFLRSPFFLQMFPFIIVLTIHKGKVNFTFVNSQRVRWLEHIEM